MSNWGFSVLLKATSTHSQDQELNHWQLPHQLRHSKKQTSFLMISGFKLLVGDSGEFWQNDLVTTELTHSVTETVTQKSKLNFNSEYNPGWN